MTIKQQGGIFGRNPTFNDVETNDLEVTGSVSVPNDSISGDAINGGTATPTTLLVNTATNPNSANSRFYGITEFDSFNATFVNFYSSNGATTLGRIGQGNYVVSGASPNGFGISSNVNLPIAAGGSTKVADFTVNGLAFPAGNGIDFSATSGTGTSELFDDYEEGTWTPSFTASGGGSASHSRQNGRYTKIGNTVFAYFQLSASKGSLSGSISISGLPFTSISLNGLDAGSVSFNRVQRFVATFNPYGHVTGDSTSIGLFKGNTNESTDATSDGVPLDAANLNTASTFRNYCFGVAIYHTS